MSTEWTQNAGMAGDVSTDNVQDFAESAQTAATNAATSETNAASSASSAATSASNASTSATNAATSATQSASSASNAATSASSAATSATDANTAKLAAEVAQVAAEAAQTQTETLFDQFGDQYLGSKASDPTVDNDGDPLTTGDIYWNSTTNTLRFYTGSAWVAPETVATNAATAAQAAQTAAELAETNAETSELSALSAEAGAIASQTLAATSATSASESETAAASSATSAASSAVSSASSASTAETQAIAASTSASQAATSATSAATSATNAATSATSASNSASAASISAGEADSSATSAATSATSASNSATAALASETAAAASETAAASSATSAATSATSAATSETNAASSETNAASSASQAVTSATNAASSASAASASATAAALSESNASASETAAASSETNAATSESNAASSATAAGASATSAASSASAASTSETNAATSESNAASSETAASGSASSASTSASNAATSATAAAGSATSASNAQTAAESARDDAQLAYDNFDDRYLGDKTSDPTLDNDGNALITGALYFNTTDNVMKVYTGSVWVAAYASLGGALLSENNLSEVASVSAARTNLGLGTAATTDSTAYATAAQGVLADSATQPGDNVSTLTNDSGYLTGNQTITLSGDVSGSGTTSIIVTVADDSHNHVISNIDSLQTTLDSKLPTAGGTMTGFITLHADPTNALHAATKEYVDTIASASLHYHDPVRVESPVALTTTYNNGTGGVGATLTNAGTQAALVIDGVTLALNDRVLIYQQANAFENGVYFVSNVGSGSTNWVLTRSTDADSYGASDPVALGLGDAFFVQEGNTGAGELYVMNTEGAITIGTTGITFAQISSAQIYVGGSGIDISGATISHADTSSQASVNNSAGTVIQDITLDTFGHVTAIGSSNLDGRYYTETETGNFFSGSTAITGYNKTNWDTAYGWGNHASAGYLTGNQTVTLSGDVSGSGTTSIAVTITKDPVITLSGAVTGSATMTNLGNVTIATTATSDPTLTLTGDATGSATFTNLGNATLTVAVVDDSHTHDTRYFTETESDARFAPIAPTSISIGGILVEDSADRSGLLEINRKGTTTWTGTQARYSGTALWSVMGNENTFGAYDDANSDWIWDYSENGAMSLYHNGVAKMSTTGTGISVVGTASATTFSGALSGNATTASTLQTARTITLSGAVTGSVSFNGGSDVSIATTATSDPTLTLTGDVSGSATFTNLGNATLTATVADNSHNHTNLDYVPERSRTDWNDSTVIGDVIGQLAWKNYGNNHTIFDASAGTSPDGTSVNNTNSATAWTATYPTLMGWNGAGTFGVRVDSARVADSAAQITTARTIALGGDVTGSASFNGSANITITAAVVNDSHTHAFNNLTAKTSGTGTYQTSGDFRAPIFYDSANTAYYFDGSATGDSIRVAGDIVAYYSDERLKDRHGNIDHALEKVNKLSGFYYTANEIAQSYGYEANMQVGLSAQEVEAVLPEIIKEAPIGDGFKTLNYAKVVPLLVEAIKELTKRIEELEAK